MPCSHVPPQPRVLEAQRRDGSIVTVNLWLSAINDERKAGERAFRAARARARSSQVRPDACERSCWISRPDRREGRRARFASGNTHESSSVDALRRPSGGRAKARRRALADGQQRPPRGRLEQGSPAVQRRPVSQRIAPRAGLEHAEGRRAELSDGSWQSGLAQNAGDCLRERQRREAR